MDSENKTNTQEIRDHNEVNSSQNQVIKGQSKILKEETITKPQTKGDKKSEKQNTMKCVMLTGPKTFQVKQVPIPKPASGQVLVKVMAAPINPSDLALFGGHYSHQKKFPTAMGFEGSGVVSESGGGVMGWSLVGKKVAFAVQKQGQGSYSQYVIVKSEQCLPLSDDTTFEQGAMSVINPMTVLALLDIAKNRKQKAVVITAAASALGKMINRLFPKEGIQVINVVRRVEQAQILKSEGAKYILNSSQQNFQNQLKTLASKLGSKLCYQAVGGDFTGIILRNMPKTSTVTVYGCLSQKNIENIQVMDLLANNKTINAFLLPEWMKTKNILSLMPIFYRVRSTINDGLKSKVAKKFKLEQIGEAIDFYLKNMTQGKVLFEPWSE